MDRSTVRELARGLPVGASRAGLICPQCGGGKTGEPSFSVTMAEDGIWYKCHRASCPMKGFRAGLMAGPAEQRAAFNPRPYPFGLAAPAPDHWLWDKLDVDGAFLLAARLGVYTKLGDASELVWEVRDFDQSARGHISRKYPEKIVRVWRTVEGPFTAFFGSRSNDLWIVEDPVSAARIATAGHSALALLGTNFSSDARAELGVYLRRLNEPLVRVALDPDASDKGAALARDLTFRLRCATIFVPLRNDPKDLSSDEFHEMLKT